MTSKHVAPSINLKSFSCPSCGAHSDQSWFCIHATRVTNNKRHPQLISAEIVESLRNDAEAMKHNDSQKAQHRREMADIFEADITGEPMLRKRDIGTDCELAMVNIHVSRCYSCQRPTIWLYDKILYPPASYEIEPNIDMNDDIRADFDEARTLLNLSPRATAALLRLCIQKLCKQVGEKGKNIDDDIKALVAKGLDPRIQQALDIVRVVGNNAVHPGAIDLTDDREIAAKLFELVNRIAYDMITHPREVAALYDEKVPSATKAAIEKRDGKKSN